MKVKTNNEGYTEIHPFDTPDPFGYIEVSKFGAIYLWVQPQVMYAAEARRYAEALLHAAELAEKGQE